MLSTLDSAITRPKFSETWHDEYRLLGSTKMGRTTTTNCTTSSRMPAATRRQRQTGMPFAPIPGGKRYRRSPGQRQVVAKVDSVFMDPTDYSPMK
jgi:hypothetical protein